jgi:hypothetical protein
MTHGTVMETCNKIIDAALIPRSAKSKQGQAWAMIRQLEHGQPDLFVAVVHKLACATAQCWTAEEISTLRTELHDAHEPTQQSRRRMYACDLVEHVREGGQNIHSVVPQPGHLPGVILAVVELAVEGTERELAASHGYVGKHRRTA